MTSESAISLVYILVFLEQVHWQLLIFHRITRKGSTKLTARQDLICFTRYCCCSSNLISVHHRMVKIYWQWGRNNKATGCWLPPKRGVERESAPLVIPGLEQFMFLFQCGLEGLVCLFLKKKQTNKKGRKTLSKCNRWPKASSCL